MLTVLIARLNSSSECRVEPGETALEFPLFLGLVAGLQKASQAVDGLPLPNFSSAHGETVFVKTSGDFHSFAPGKKLCSSPVSNT